MISGTETRPGIPSNLRIFESNWLDIERQFELTLNIESIWLKLHKPINTSFCITFSWQVHIEYSQTILDLLYYSSQLHDFLKIPHSEFQAVKTFLKLMQLMQSVSWVMELTQVNSMTFWKSLTLNFNQWRPSWNWCNWCSPCVSCLHSTSWSTSDIQVNLNRREVPALRYSGLHWVW